MNVLFVLLGGGVGAVARYLLMGWVQSATGATLFPWGTLLVNVSGCLLIGLLSQVSDLRGALPPATRALLFTGLLGGFTTYSTFGNEAWTLGVAGDWWRTAAYVVLHIVLGVGAVGVGRLLAVLVLG